MIEPRGSEMYVHEKMRAALESLTGTATDETIIAAITDYILAGQRMPITLALNHNAKASPCPLKIDRPGAKQSSVALHNAEIARAWMIEALRRGYEVTAGTHRGQETMSVASVQRSIKHREAMAEYRAHGNDDEIPF